MTEIERLLAQPRFLGYDLIATEYAPSDLVRVKTHKKKRIDKKWRKRYGYKRVPRPTLYITADGKIIGHPKYIDQLIAAVKKDATIHRLEE